MENNVEKLLLTVGIISVVACVLFLVFAVFNRIGYYNLLDGEGDLYKRLYRRMIISFVLSIAFAAVGVACLFIRFKM